MTDSLTLKAEEVSACLDDLRQMLQITYDLAHDALYPDKDSSRLAEYERTARLFLPEGQRDLVIWSIGHVMGMLKDTEAALDAMTAGDADSAGAT